jgi:AcrR family transcriptional regulator
MDSAVANVIVHLEQAARDGLLSQADVECALGMLRPQPVGAAGRNGDPDRREQILSAAARHFAQRGYHGTNLQDIAEELGLTRPTFYYHFKNKQEILATITEMAVGRAEGVLDQVAVGDGDAAARLRSFIVEYVRINVAYPEAPALFRSFHELPVEKQEQMRERRSAVDHRLAALIAEGAEDGSLRSPAPLITAFGILGAVNWMHEWYRPDGRLGWEEIADIIAGLLLDGVRARQ